MGRCRGTVRTGRRPREDVLEWWSRLRRRSCFSSMIRSFLFDPIEFKVQYIQRADLKISLRAHNKFS